MIARIVLVGSLWLAPSLAGGSTRLTASDLRELNRAADSVQVVSPDGRWLAYTLPRDPAEGHAGRDIFIRDLSSGSTKRITAIGNNIQCSWSPDGKMLAYYSQPHRDWVDWASRGPQAKNEVHVWNRQTEFTTEFSDIQIAEYSATDNPPIPQWSPDSTTLYVAVNAAGVPDVTEELSSSASENDVEVLSFPTAAGYTNPSDPYLRRRQSRVDVVRLDIASRTISDRIDSGADPAELDIPGGGVVSSGYQVTGLLISPDGKMLAVAINSPSAQTLVAAGAPKIRVFDLGAGRMQAINFEGDLRKVTLEAGSRYIAWSPDSRFVTLRGLRQNFSPKNSQEKETDLLVVDTVERRVANITTNMRVEGSDTPFKISTDDRFPPVWISDTNRILVASKGKAWSLSLKDNTARQISGENTAGWTLTGLFRTGVPFNFWGYGQKAYCIALKKERGCVAIAIGLRPDGSRSLWAVTEDRCTLLATLHDRYLEMTPALKEADLSGKVLLAVSSATAPLELMQIDVGAQIVTAIPLTNIRIPAPLSERRVLNWEAPSGRANGLLLLPPDTKIGASLPLVVSIYPGTNAYSSGSWLGGVADFPAELLVQSGYAVFFAGLPIGNRDPFRDIGKNFDPALDAVIATGCIDPKKVAVWGHSYGAYGVFCLAVQSSRIAAGIAVDGPADLVAASLGSQEGPNWSLGQGRMPALPWRAAHDYVRNSPIFHADALRIPLLIIFGRDDGVFPAMSGKMMFEAARAEGVPSQYVCYPGGHSVSDWAPNHQDDYWNRVTSWLDLWLKNMPNATFGNTLKMKEDFELKGKTVENPKGSGF